jgi:glycosyltransferase involved in cell wall biosynthesis
MKLLVLAQTPPPLHGQSAMVKALLEGLPAHGIAVHPVNLRLSQDSADIGRWRLRKIFATCRFAVQAIRARFDHDCTTLYYIPAPPAKRGALYRDWLLMLLCRPFFARCVLHWHAAGLGVWLATHANFVERAISRLLLGRAHLSIVLANALRADAECLRPRRIAVVPNGIGVPPASPPPLLNRPFRLLFLGLCSEEKGVFAAASAVLEANRRTDGSETNPAFTHTLAGPFDRNTTRDRLHRLCGEYPNLLNYVGVVDDGGKARLFATCHALLFPTRYSAEGMPLVAIEALAHDRPVIATQWRALPEIVTPDVGILVPPGNEAALAAALLRLRDHPPAPRACRARFLSHFTLEGHLTALAEALTALHRPTRR